MKSVHLLTNHIADLDKIIAVLKRFHAWANHIKAITKTRNGESGKGIGEWGMGNEEW